ncbi:NUDIX hydrolase [Candidatus Woesearchaeota archaeon]|jgi:8-oxo-dGTP diphosphatase|nr:NUDIX hydrolase [Candidatus Woesearchaeota archaeon]MBT4111282.1 NUDIX hydrolase [Candidatus Woesearchaeota archaeon]MBT4335807.1 NUDIX hydrolase [Candidatus Woesearchaeota archaeon]MBT4469215.1 NUDIX hydrolase [Candidatus Woesearchaeota archaeon]MBT6744380.1 NUDIX hydrolase [Candidatus Woesearchaeota archaeon]
MDKLTQKTLVAGFLYHQDKVLLLRRVSSKTFLPDFYERPGGHQEVDEDLETAIIREFLEETGLSIIVGSQYFEYTHPIDETQYTEYSFFVKAQEDPISISLSSEHSKYVWVDKNELDQYKIDPNEKRAILEGFENIGSY